MAKDYIKPYIVQIKGSLGSGSGVLVKKENGKYYIFTAKHNFKSTENQKVEEIEVEYIKEDIERKKVKVISYHDIEVNSVIGLDDLSIDFVVLVVDENSFKYLNTTLSIEPLKIYNDKFEGCIVSGYPRTKISTDAIYLDCKYETENQEYEKKDDYKHTFKVSSLYSLNRSGITEVNTISGISGGGVFVKGEDEKIHLVGIEIEYIAIHNLVCVRLKDVIDEIDKKLSKSKKDNTLKEKILLSNGKSFTLEFIKVKLEDDKTLYVGKYPVTFEEYDMFCNKTKSVWGRGKNPIININYNNANSYCRWLTDNIKDNNIIFRLPTSKEWTEIATQNFSQDNFSNYKISDKVKKVIDTEKGKLGIYGMYGNVHEWCYYEKCEEIKIVKGGSFRNSLKYISDVTKITEFLSEERNEEVSFRIIAEKIYNKNI